MKHIVNTARGSMAKTQDDLLKIAMNSSPIKEENLQHPLCDFGFFEVGEQGMVRMTDDTFKQALKSIMKSRPTAHLWDITPAEIPYSEVTLLIESPEAYRMSFEDRVAYVAQEFNRRPNMVGLRWELHGVPTSSKESPTGQPSVSIYLYEADEDLASSVPVKIKTRYRSNF